MLARKQLTYEDGEAMKVLPHVVAVDCIAAIPLACRITGQFLGQVRKP